MDSLNLQSASAREMDVLPPQQKKAWRPARTGTIVAKEKSTMPSLDKALRAKSPRRKKPTDYVQQKVSPQRSKNLRSRFKTATVKIAKLSALKKTPSTELARPGTPEDPLLSWIE